MRKCYISQTTGEIVWSVFEIVPRLIERDFRGNLFFNFTWKRETVGFYNTKDEGVII